MIVGTCPRCHGQLTEQYDDGWEEECLQCGFIRPIKTPKTNHLNHAQYDVSMPYTASPLVCRCVLYETIPMFARSGWLEQDQRQ